MRALTLALIFLLQYQYLSGQGSNWNNACPNWLQYNFRWFLPQCFFNPDVSGEIVSIYFIIFYKPCFLFIRNFLDGYCSKI